MAENMVDWDLINRVISKVFSEMQNIQITNIQFPQDGMLDLIVTIEFLDGKKKDLLIVISSSGEPRIIKSKILDLLNYTQDGYPVYMAPYISENSREIIKEYGIGFIDLSGNAYISFENVLISRIGYENRFRKKRTMVKLFSKKSTRIIRKLLADPNRTWKTTELAEEARVSLGFVSTAIKNLAEEGFLDREWGSIKLINPAGLLDKWSGEYRFDNQTSIGYYCPYKDREQVFRRLREINGDQYALTMGAAASLIAPHVRSTDIYLYSSNNSKLIKKLELTPVEFGGNLYLVDPGDQGVLFDKQDVDGLSIVSNIQLYLDLFNYPARGREQAEFLRETVMEI